MRLIHDPESALQPSCESDYEDDDDCMKQHAMVVPTELASAILVWLKRHHHLGREQFRLLAPFLFYEWDLKDLVELDTSWFDAIPRTPLQYLKNINVSGCHELESLGVTQDAFSLPIEKLPSLMIANFQGCTKLSRSVLDVLQFSTKLISLNLSGCRKIDDQSLGAIQRLQCLESLDLALRKIGRIRTLNTLILRGCNDISDDGMSSLSGLECLQYVDARHCEEIRSLPISWTDIRVLLLGRTSFGEADAAVLQYMPKLQELDLRSCRILKRGIEFINRLERLERLVLAETALTDAGLIEICKHNVYLKALDVSGTEVTDAGTMGLANLKDLEVLSLDTSGITNRSLANLTCLPRLEKLDLFGASITDNGLLHLVPLRRLKELEICSGTISDRGVELISKITTLTSLNLSQNRNIHAKSLVYIRSLTELRYLNLSNTSISALSLRHLYSLKELQSLSVYGCALTPSHIDVLRDILPELRENTPLELRALKAKT
uniref:F-box domain-containing protein n=1 Tax=Globisporangium ultimum (strain ATCC 200006 / CBS 805.95 / DAOM BR144) TaxID=431595 RepID=K3W816_GLOUD